VADLLSMLYEYRKLAARDELLGDRLPACDQRRLEALDRLFAADPDDTNPSIRCGQPRRRHARADVDIPATVTVQGRPERVRIINVGGGGVCVEPAPPLRAGEHAVIRVFIGGREYHYPVCARWARTTANGSTMGMPFTGPPLRLGAT